MEDLVPLLIFVVIAVVNLMKYLAEKNSKKKPAQSGSAPPKKASSLEDFFTKLAAQVEPQPTELPDWPEGYERPDYMAEAEDYKQAEAEPAVMMPQPMHEPAPVLRPSMDSAPAVKSRRTSSLISSIKSTPAIVSSTNGLRMSIPLMLSGASAGSVDFSLNNKKQLRQAMLANLVFSPPRAYDRSFETTVAK